MNVFWLKKQHFFTCMQQTLLTKNKTALGKGKNMNCNCPKPAFPPNISPLPPSLSDSWEKETLDVVPFQSYIALTQQLEVVPLWGVADVPLLVHQVQLADGVDVGPAATLHHCAGVHRQLLHPATTGDKPVLDWAQLYNISQEVIGVQGDAPMHSQTPEFCFPCFLTLC